MVLADPQIMEGSIDFVYDGETYHTYYKCIGALENRTRTPLIALHGGPGLVHNYLTVLIDLAAKYDIPVILYDQLGNGKSSHLKDKPSSFWTVDVFVEELSNLLNHFGINDDFDLLGHSWGGMLASELAVRRQPLGLKHLVISNSPASFTLWMQSTMQLSQAFSDDVKQGLMDGMKNPPKYLEALLKLHSVHGCTTQPFPTDYLYTLNQVFGPDGDPTVAASPMVQGWTIIDRLHLIQVPALIVNGRRDLAQDFVVQPFFDKIKKVKWITFENSSHSPFIEERDRYMSSVASFLEL